MKGHSFVKGAFVLAVAGLASRLLGALYRIVLPWLMGGAEKGGEGMGLFQMAYPVYSVALGLSAIGIPVAISKLVAEKAAVNDRAGVFKVFSVSAALLATIGAITSVLLFSGARYIAVSVSKDPRAFYTIASISPAIFFVSVMSSFRGFFQGLQHMAPSANSQIIEQIVRVITMFVLIPLLLPRGIEFAAAGATFGAVTGALGGLAYLLWVFCRSSQQLVLNLSRRPTGEAEGSLDIIKRIVHLAAPISLAGIVLPITSFIDMAVVPARLHAVGYETEEATTLFGYFSAMALPLVNMPTVFTSALAVSLVPAVSEAQAVENARLIRSRAMTAVRLALYLSLPAAAGLYILSVQIPTMLWNAPQAGPSLAALSAGLVFLAIQQVTSGVLQGLGYTGIPVKSLLIGAAVKLFLTWVLTANASLNVSGAALATVAGFLVASLMNMFWVASLVGPVFDVREMVVKPLIATGAMALAVKVVYLQGIAATANNSISTLVSIGAGAVTYGFLLLMVGGIRSRDLELVPRVGPAVVGYLRRFGLIRD